MVEIPGGQLQKVTAVPHAQRQARILAAVQAEPNGWTDCIDRDIAEVWDAAWARTLAIESR